MTTKRTSVMVVYGTRPEAIKVAPIIMALKKSSTLRPVTLVTAQHREMLDQVNRVFRIAPDVDLDLMQPEQSLNQVAARILQSIDVELVRHEPAAVLVQGDTTTVMATAVAAFNRSIPVVHLEAGLRSGNLSSPFPEEGNRKLVSQLAALHLAPTNQARNNLLAEGIKSECIRVTGNTVIDALHWAVARPASFSDRSLAVLEKTDRRMLLLTAHRRENLGERMRQIGEAVGTIARRHPDILVVWPAHKNPQVRNAIRPYLAKLDNLIMVEPVGYHEFTHLIRRSYIVLTDSGGLQEEAPSLGKPVLVLRNNTERPEVVAAGAARLVGTDPTTVVAEVNRLLLDQKAYAEMATSINPYGHGNAAVECVHAIQQLLGARGQATP